MKKKLNINLYKSLITTDFFFFKSIRKNNSYLAFSKQNLNFLSVFELQKEIKQLANLLNSVKKTSNNILVIIVENEHQKILLNNLISMTKISNNILITNQNDFLNYKKDNSCIYFVITFVYFNEKKLKSFAYSQKILLIDEINNNIHIKKSCSVYNITNKIDTNKKIYFLFLLIENIFNK